MSRDEFGHLEHTYLTLAVKDRSERIVRIDLRPLLFVLKTVFLNIVPELLRQFGTRKWRRTDDSCELVIGLDWSHEGRVRLAFGSLFGFRHRR